MRVDRRGFLKALGLGAGAVCAGIIQQLPRSEAAEASEASYRVVPGCVSFRLEPRPDKVGRLQLSMLWEDARGNRWSLHDLLSGYDVYLGSPTPEPTTRHVDAVQRLMLDKVRDWRHSYGQTYGRVRPGWDLLTL